MQSAGVSNELGFCSANDVVQSKLAGIVHECAYNNPVLGQGFCGTGERGICEISSGVGTGNTEEFQIYSKDGNSLGHINQYDTTECLDAYNYGVSDHESLKYDVEYDRDAKFYLAKVSTSCTGGDCNNGGTKKFTNIDVSNSNDPEYVDPRDIGALQQALLAERAVELYNNESGGNFSTFFGASYSGTDPSDSPTIASAFLAEAGEIDFGSTIYRSENPNFRPTISMIDKSITFGDLVSCAMQPYDLTAMIHPYGESVAASAGNTAGSTVQVKNASKTTAQGVLSSIESGGVVAASANGHKTFGTQIADYSQAGLVASASGNEELYEKVQVKSKNVTPTPATGQQDFAFASAGSNRLTGSVGSPADPPEPYQYDGCERCSAYVYRDHITGKTHYPVFNKNCNSVIATMGETEVVTINRADGSTADVVKCLSGCPAGLGAPTHDSSVFDANEMVDNITQHVCDFNYFLNKNKYHGGIDSSYF